jgi:RNA polymerase sigma-70 factor (ECF subfamily)
MDTPVRTNDEWTTQLVLPAPECNPAINDLRNYLRRGLLAFLKRRGRLDEDTAEDLVQESVLRILEKIDTFQGKARFTTWAMKIAVNMCLSELRRRRWKEISLEDFDYGEPLFKEGKFNKIFDSPEKKALKSSFFEIFEQILMNSLSEKQREVMSAVMLYGMPLEEVSQRIGSNRNAVYKMMHDARKKMKSAFEEQGIGPKDIQELFS